MSKLPVVKSKDIIKVLNKFGFEEVRSKGSHIHFKKGSNIVTVPYHSKDLHPKTLKSILRQARMTIEELKELL